MSVDHESSLSSHAALSSNDRDCFLAMCCSYAYDDVENLELAFSGNNARWLFDSDNRVEIVSQRLSCFIICSKEYNEAIVAFRGTVSWENWLFNNIFNVFLTTWPNTTDVLVGAGFYNAWVALKGFVQSHLEGVLANLGDAPGRITFTGHSLGAAIAQLAFFDLASVYRDAGYSVDMTSFASPLVGNSGYASAYAQLLSQSPGRLTSKTFLNIQDPIETWANRMMREGDTIPGGVQYVDTLMPVKLPPQSGAHAMAIYLRLLQLAQPATNNFLGCDDGTRLLIRITTSDDTGADTGAEVYFRCGIAEDGTGGRAVQLVRFDGEPFLRGETSSFVITAPAWNAQRDLLRCSLAIMPQQGLIWGAYYDAWRVGSIQLLVEGATTTLLPDINVDLDTWNPNFSFSGLAPTLMAFGVNWVTKEVVKHGATTPAVAATPEGIVVCVSANHDEHFYCQAGEIKEDLSIAWGPGEVYETGLGKDPKIAVNSDGWVVEVHRAVKSDYLYFRTGMLTNGPLGVSVQWSEATSFDKQGGETPAVAVLGNTVVEVHKDTGNDNLFYNTGMRTATDSVRWSSGGRKTIGIEGTTPAVAIMPDKRVILVFKGAGKGTKLFYTIGVLDTTENTVAFDGPVVEYDGDAQHPTVAVDTFGRILVAHRGGRGVNYRVGSAFSGRTITWGSKPELVSSVQGSTGVALNDKGQAVLVQTAESDIELTTGVWKTNPFPPPPSYPDATKSSDPRTLRATQGGRSGDDATSPDTPERSNDE